MMTAPTWDGGSLIIAGVNIYPLTIFSISLSLEKKGEGGGWGEGQEILKLICAGQISSKARNRM